MVVIQQAAHGRAVAVIANHVRCICEMFLAPRAKCLRSP
jgi:hypothetical protein